MKLNEFLAAWAMVPRLRRERMREMIIAARIAHHAKSTDYQQALHDLD